MSRRVYNKLVRDLIPEIIEAQGRACHVETMTDAEYRQALLDKLVEEVQEIRGATNDTLSEELADAYEVMDAIIAVFGLQKEDILAIQAEKRNTRGGFSRRLRLVDTD